MKPRFSPVFHTFFRESEHLFGFLLPKEMASQISDKISFTYNPMEIRYFTTGPPPKRGTEESAAFDLYASEDILLVPMKRFKIPTGLYLEIPSGFYGRIACRSGLGFKGMVVTGGVIDSDYRAEIGILGVWFGDEQLEIKKDERCAQIIFEIVADRYFKIPMVPVGSVEALTNTVRGTGGFGSTGMK
jgi:dUTP pyrophosphatase